MKKIISLQVIFFIVLYTSVVLPQKDTNPLKSEAQKQMNAGRYGEAIDLLNRYISANPQKADGYNLRGLCNEKRAQYEQAVYDFRSARKLEPNNKEINQNLSRTTDAWYKLLYNKIEGHKREIAINSNAPRNYLEIGKSYKNLGEWATAETWYDEYLKREEASADEIIRYTEILAKNGHIKKGEPILKKYTDKYPEDHRLWSRYGYFLLWLGKNKLAIDAFESALALRPYFREAMDGLDLAKGKGYVYTVNDTSARHNYGMPSSYGKAFPIDKFYKQLKKNPNDNKTRYLLIEELVKYQRYNEAFDQIEIISRDTAYSEMITAYRERVNFVRDSIFELKLADFTARIEKDPSDKEAVIQLADYYGRQQDYDTALVIMENYLNAVPQDSGKDVRFKYASFAAWNYQFERAIEQLNILIAREPDNIDYKLLRAQVAVWTSQDLELAEQYLGEVLSKEPDNLMAITSLASMKIRQEKFDEAKELLDRANAIDPGSKEVEAVQIYYDGTLSNYEGRKIYQILFDARDLVVAKDCEGALLKYEEYFSKISGPTRMEEAEYAGVNSCAGRYDKALEIYDRLLAEEYDFDLAVERAKTYIWAGDSVKALAELQRLVTEKPDDYEARLNLAVAYEYNREYDEAEDIYDQLLTETQDSSKIVMLEQRKGWLPSSSFGAAFGSFPSHIGLAPFANYYSDNQDFQFHNLGARLEFGITSFLSVGASFTRTTLDTRFTFKNLTSFKWHLFLRPVNRLSIDAGFGQLSVQNEAKRNISDASIKFEETDNYMIKALYENTDARLILYSPNLVNIIFDADMFRLQGYYYNKSGLRVSGHFTYISVEDGNRGNDFQFRIGKRFFQSLTLGYEFLYTNYKRTSLFYYSPQDFEAHCLWADWEAVKTSEVKINLGGKLGYVPQSDFIIREASGEISYNPLPNFFLSGRISVGNTYRFNSSYNFFSAFVSAYLSFN